MRITGRAWQVPVSGSKHRISSTSRSLAVWTFSLLDLLALASGNGGTRRNLGSRGVGGSTRKRISGRGGGGGIRRSIGGTGGGGISGGGGGGLRRKGGEGTTSFRSAAPREDLAILLDCDAQSLPTMLNFLLGMNKFFDIADVVDMTHVVCLDDKSCRAVSKIGLKIASNGIANTVRDGFNAMAKNIEPEKFMLPGNVSYRGNWLDDVMLAREYALLDLLNQKKIVLRSNADTCFRENPFALMSSAQSDVAVTVQPLDPALENGSWAYDWSCPDSKESKLELTLNNGVILVDGRRKSARDTYALAVGSGVKLLYRQANGWAQQGLNAALHDENLCLKPVETGKKTLRGVTSRGLGIVSIDVCSPCEGCVDASSSLVAHANCEFPLTAKTTWLQSVSCWFMPSDWEQVRSTGDAAEYLRHLKIKAWNEQ